MFYEFDEVDFELMVPLNVQSQYRKFSACDTFFTLVTLRPWRNKFPFMARVSILDGIHHLNECPESSLFTAVQRKRLQERWDERKGESRLSNSLGDQNYYCLEIRCMGLWKNVVDFQFMVPMNSAKYRIRKSQNSYKKYLNISFLLVLAYIEATKRKEDTRKS